VLVVEWGPGWGRSQSGGCTVMVLQWGPGWGGTDGCTRMLVQMNTDGDKVD
jgi:hypothetical protein